MRVVALLVLLVVCCTKVVHADASYIYDTHNKIKISQQRLMSELVAADVVLLGEKHDEARQHQLQRQLLEQTQLQRQHGSVLLEMLTPSQQSNVDRVKAWLAQGGHSGKRSLLEKMRWNEAWDTALYQDLVYSLMHQPARILAANPDKSRVAQAGDFVPAGKLSQDVQVRTALATIMGQSNPMHTLVGKQQFKDHHMAEALLTAAKPAWLIAGAFHCSKLLGVPLFLTDAQYTGSVKVLIMTEIGTEISDAHADYIWFIAP